MSDTSSGSPRSNAKSSAKRGARAPCQEERGAPGRTCEERRASPNLPPHPAPNAPARGATRHVSRQRPKKQPAKAKAASKRVQDSVPRQGFETEGDPVSGPVQPPGNVDLLSSAAELAGELTKSGLSSGGRLLKDFIARLPLN